MNGSSLMTVIVTKGAYTVHSADGAITAKAGEVIFLTKGTNVVEQEPAR